MAVENTLAYYNTTAIMSAKGFIVQTPGINGIQHFFSTIDAVLK
jgi:hypothetical protein